MGVKNLFWCCRDIPQLMNCLLSIFLVAGSGL
jgi:hypothetical protein